MSDLDTKTAEARAARSRGGRPTKAAAAERDERLLDIAITMFMEQGFEATSMDGLAEAAGIGKATLTRATQIRRRFSRTSCGAASSTSMASWKTKCSAIRATYP